MQSIAFRHFLLPLAVLALSGASTLASADTSPTLYSGVDTNNNITQTAGGAVDTNWNFTGYYDSYGLSRSQVFGNSVSNPNGAIGYNISSPDASAASMGPVNTAAAVVTGGNRPGWYNPGTGAQWLADTAVQQNGGIPINPPGQLRVPDEPLPFRKCQRRHGNGHHCRH